MPWRACSRRICGTFRQGVRGPADDPVILYREWGLDLEAVNTQVHLYHGEHDRFAPLSHAVYIDEGLPRSSLRVYEGEGHLFMLNLFDAVFEQVAG